MKIFPKLLSDNKDFAKLFYAGCISELGGFLTDTAIALHLYNLTNQNPVFLGIARASYIFFFLIGNLFGGALGNQFSKKKILIFCEAMRIPLSLSLLFLKSPEIIILINAFIGIFTGAFSPSKKSLGNDLVEINQVNLVQSYFSTAMAMFHLIAPMLAAYVYTQFGFNKIIYFDFFSYLIGVFLLIRIASKEKLIKEELGVIQLIKEGLDYSIKNYAMRAVFLNGVISGLSIGFLISLLLPYLDQIFSAPSKMYGTLLSLFGLGGICGGVCFLTLNKYISKGKIIFYLNLVESSILLIWLQVQGPILSSLLFFIWGVFVFARLTAQMSLISNDSPKELQNRLFSVIEVSFMLPNVIGSLLASYLVTIHSAQNILLGVGVFFFLATLIRFPLKETRELLKV